MLLIISRCAGVFLRNTLKPSVLSLTECHSWLSPFLPRFGGCHLFFPRSPVRFDSVLPVRVEGLEPGFQLAVAVLGLHGLERVAIGGGLAEQVLDHRELGLDLADLTLEIGGLAIGEFLLRAAVAVHGSRAGRSRG